MVCVAWRSPHARRYTTEVRRRHSVHTMAITSAETRDDNRLPRDRPTPSSIHIHKCMHTYGAHSTHMPTYVNASVWLELTVLSSFADVCLVLLINRHHVEHMYETDRRVWTERVRVCGAFTRCACVVTSCTVRLCGGGGMRCWFFLFVGMAWASKMGSPLSEMCSKHVDGFAFP